MRKKKVSRSTTVKHNEHHEQVELFKFFSENSKEFPELELAFAIPNAGKRSYWLANYLKAEGLRSGIPDLFLPSAHGGWFGLFIEMKIKGNKPSDNQKWWLRKLRLAGYKTTVCYSAMEAIKLVKKYITNGYKRRSVRI